MTISEGKVIAIFVAYGLSLAAAFAVSHSFAVMGAGDFFLFGLYALSLPAVLLFVLAKGHPGRVVAVAHILFAVLIHPSFTLSEADPVQRESQFEMLRSAQAAREPWWSRADAAYTLARSLKSDVVAAYRIQNPILYWLHPPSVTLGVWGVVCFLFWPKSHARE